MYQNFPVIGIVLYDTRVVSYDLQPCLFIKSNLIFIVAQIIEK